MISVEQLKTKPVPQHVAVIMDGNGRWAKEQGLERMEGHKQGATALRNVLEAALAVGVKYLTVYAFSMENWQRSPEEVNALMTLFVNACRNEIDNLMQNHIRFRAIGKLDMLSDECLKALQETENLTKDNAALNLVVCLSYGSRWEIAQAAKRIAIEVKNKKLDVEDIDEGVFTQYLQTHSIPDPDLLIRTSNEFRVSNFLLWQIAYTELYFTNVYWPGFTKEDFFATIADYQQRERRFGMTSEQILTNAK
jgi:undecaprenyl diphosphate synthase